MFLENEKSGSIYMYFFSNMNQHVMNLVAFIFEFSSCIFLLLYECILYYYYSYFYISINFE